MFPWPLLLALLDDGESVPVMGRASGRPQAGAAELGGKARLEETSRSVKNTGSGASGEAGVSGSFGGKGRGVQARARRRHLFSHSQRWPEKPPKTRALEPPVPQPISLGPAPHLSSIPSPLTNLSVASRLVA